MNRLVAKTIHETTNMTYWAENPSWSSGNRVLDMAGTALRALPFSVHELQKRTLFDTDELIAVSGETVVVGNGPDTVDKFMFRYPAGMSTEKFAEHTAFEVRVVTDYLASIALATEVGIKNADIFRWPLGSVIAVTQTQPRMDLTVNPVLDVSAVLEEAHSDVNDQTARDIERLVEQSTLLLDEYGFYPDIAHSSGNVRRNLFDGSVRLIDVMPFYKDGTRLIGDKSPTDDPWLAHSLREYEEFVGNYGA